MGVLRFYKLYILYSDVYSITIGRTLIFGLENPDFMVCHPICGKYGEAIVSILPNESYGKKFQNTTLPDCKIYGMSRYRLLRSRLSKNHKPLISCFVNI